MRIKGRQEADFFSWFFTVGDHGAVPFSPEAMVEATGNPVSRAVMRHLGIDQPSERHEAQQQKGIVVIVHGPPWAGV